MECLAGNIGGGVKLVSVPVEVLGDVRPWVQTAEVLTDSRTAEVLVARVPAPGARADRRQAVTALAWAGQPAGGRPDPRAVVGGHRVPASNRRFLVGRRSGLVQSFRFPESFAGDDGFGEGLGFALDSPVRFVGVLPADGAGAPPGAPGGEADGGGIPGAPDGGIDGGGWDGPPGSAAAGGRGGLSSGPAATSVPATSGATGESAARGVTARAVVKDAAFSGAGGGGGAGGAGGAAIEDAASNGDGAAGGAASEAVAAAAAFGAVAAAATAPGAGVGAPRVVVLTESGLGVILRWDRCQVLRQGGRPPPEAPAAGAKVEPLPPGVSAPPPTVFTAQKTPPSSAGGGGAGAAGTAGAAAAAAGVPGAAAAGVPGAARPPTPNPLLGDAPLLAPSPGYRPVVLRLSDESLFTPVPFRAARGRRPRACRPGRPRSRPAADDPLPYGFLDVTHADVSSSDVRAPVERAFRVPGPVHAADQSACRPELLAFGGEGSALKVLNLRSLLAEFSAKPRPADALGVSEVVSVRAVRFLDRFPGARALCAGSRLGRVQVFDRMQQARPVLEFAPFAFGSAVASIGCSAVLRVADTEDPYERECARRAEAAAAGSEGSTRAGNSGGSDGETRGRDGRRGYNGASGGSRDGTCGASCDRTPGGGDSSEVSDGGSGFSGESCGESEGSHAEAGGGSRKRRSPSPEAAEKSGSSLAAEASRRAASDVKRRKAADGVTGAAGAAVHSDSLRPSAGSDGSDGPSGRGHSGRGCSGRGRFGSASVSSESGRSDSDAGSGDEGGGSGDSDGSDESGNPSLDSDDPGSDDSDSGGSDFGSDSDSASDVSASDESAPEGSGRGKVTCPAAALAPFEWRANVDETGFGVSRVTQFITVSNNAGDVKTFTIFAKPRGMAPDNFRERPTRIRWVRHEYGKHRADMPTLAPPQGLQTVFGFRPEAKFRGPVGAVVDLANSPMWPYSCVLGCSIDRYLYIWDRRCHKARKKVYLQTPLSSVLISASIRTDASLLRRLGSGD